MPRKPKYRIGEPGPAWVPPLELSPVAIAEPDDFDELLAFLKNLRTEIDGGTADWDLVRELTLDLVNRDGGIVFVVRGYDSRIEASLGMKFYRRMLARPYFLRIMWNMVIPDKRKTGHAKSLLVRACKFSDDVGCPLWHEEFAPTNDAPKVRLAGRHLLPAGFVFTHLPSAVA